MLLRLEKFLEFISLACSTPKDGVTIYDAAFDTDFKHRKVCAAKVFHALQTVYDGI